MRFLIDAQLPPLLAARLTALGHQAVHVTQVLAGNAPDLALWSHADAHGQVIISKDSDLVALARQARPPVQLLWVRLGNCGNRALVDRLLAALPDLCRDLEAGAAVVALS